MARNVQTVGVSLPAAVLRAAKHAAVDADISLSAWITRLVMMALADKVAIDTVAGGSLGQLDLEDAVREAEARTVDLPSAPASAAPAKPRAPRKSKNA